MLVWNDLSQKGRKSTEGILEYGAGENIRSQEGAR
jgi:hypothetical protein